MNDPQKTFSVLFYGIGGQGVLTAAEICARAAMIDGYHVKKSEVKGMAQRGGSVETYVRFGTRVSSPLPLNADCDVIVCLHPSEHGRLKDQLKPSGVDLSSYLGQADQAVGEKKIFMNAFMLGVVSSRLPIREQSWIAAMDQTFKKERTRNQEFFQQGRKQGARS